MVGHGMHFFTMLVLRTIYTIAQIRYKLLKSVISFAAANYVGQLQLSAFFLVTTFLTPCPTITMMDVCPNENVTFWLYNENLKEPYQFNVDDPTSMKEAPFIYKAPVKILMHGYGGHKNDGPNPQLRPAYVEVGYNVITVDYQPVVRKPCYLQAVSNIEIIARCIADFIGTLLKNTPFTRRWLHVVSFSLGTHIAVTTGRMLINRGITLPRVTVLDAAAPMFYMGHRFTVPRCAEFVDAIHTNVGLYGKTTKIGDVDFYVNFLFFQLGCSITDISCNHAKAPEYFAESILTPVGFWGYPIEGQSHIEIMGEYTPQEARGIYYVATETTPPYATGTQFPNKFLEIRSTVWELYLEIYDLGELVLSELGKFRIFYIPARICKKMWLKLLGLVQLFWDIDQIYEHCRSVVRRKMRYLERKVFSN